MTEAKVVHLFKGHMDGTTAVVESGISLCCKVWGPKGLGTVIPGEETCSPEFDALLVGPPTTGGLIRHRARRLGFVRRLLGLGRP